MKRRDVLKLGLTTICGILVTQPHWIHGIKHSAQENTPTKEFLPLISNPEPDPTHFVLFYDDFNRDNGTVGNGWTGSAWAIIGQKAVCTPFLSSELLSNCDFSLWSGDEPAGWTVSPGNLSGISQVGPGEAHGGSGTGRLNIYQAGSQSAFVSQDVLSLTQGQYYLLTAVMDQYTAGRVDITGLAAPIAAQKRMALQVKADYATSVTLKASSTVNPTDQTWTSLSVKQFLTPFLLRPYGAKNARVMATLDLDEDRLSGVIACANDLVAPTSYIHAVRRGTNIHLIQCNNKQFTELGSKPATLHATGEIELRIHPPEVDVWLDDKFLMTGLIDAALAYGTHVGLMQLNSGTGGENFSVEAYTYHAADSAYASSATFPLTIPTYDGSGQQVHPDVYYNPSGWNGHKYWMCMTPYADLDSALENPSIVVSEDGETWVEPAGLANPVVPAEANLIHSDNDLLVDGAGTMWLFFRKSDDYTGHAGTYDQIWETHSTNGITWTPPVMLFASVFRTELSPTVVYDGAQYVMWTCDAIDDFNRKLYRRTCPAPNGTWSERILCTVSRYSSSLLPEPWLWHQDVVFYQGLYYGLFNTNNENLYLGTSADGITWQMGISPLMKKAEQVWNDQRLYRGCLIPNALGFDCFYGGWQNNGPETICRVGRTQVYFDF